MDVGKNTYNSVETYNYLNMKQNDGITFCTQLSLFFLKEFAYNIETPYVYTRCY